MVKKETFEVTAYPIGSTVWIIYHNKLLPNKVIEMTLHSIGHLVVPRSYTLATEGGAIDFHPIDVFPNKQKLIDSL